MSRLWLVRHAKAAVQGLCYGRTEVPVCVAPEAAAEQVQQRLSAHGVSLPTSSVWTSPSARCLSVALALHRLGAPPPAVEPRLCELSFGAWEGLSYASIEEQEPARYQTWMEQWRTSAPPGGETVDELLLRTRQWLEAVRGQSGELVVMAHAGSIRALRCHLTGISFAQAMSQEVAHLEPEAHHLPEALPPEP